MSNNNSNNKSRSQKNKPMQKQPKAKAPRKQKRGQQKQEMAAAAYATGQVGKAPVIKMSRDTCRIVHRELISSVTGSVNFAVLQSFALNPGLAATFPWLSIMAQGWEQYRFRKLRFCYYTRTGSTTPGSVILAPDYDAADAAPASEQIASAFEDVAEDAPWKDIECDLTMLSMAAGTKRHFTRSGALAANLDIKTYDVGNLHLCTIDGTAVPWGKLWVEYDVDFFVPQLPPTGASLALGGTTTSGGALSAANPLGPTPNQDAQLVGYSVNAASVVTFQSAGTFLVTVAMGGTVISALGATASSGATVNALQAVTINGAATFAVALLRVVVSLAGATMTITSAASTVTGTILYVASAPDSSLA